VHINEEALRSSLQRLREAAFDADLAGVMKRAVDAVHRVSGCGGAGIMFMTENGRLSYVAASGEAGRQLEEAQARAGQGPCYDSYVYAREVTSRDVHHDSRWPELPAYLPSEVQAVAGVPILLSGSPVGTLNVYRDVPNDWHALDMRALHAYAALLAEVVGSALAARDHSVLADQLRYALDYRVTIERAVGYLMGTQGLDAVTAFDLLRKQARDNRRRVADVASEVLTHADASGQSDHSPA